MCYAYGMQTTEAGDGDDIQGLGLIAAWEFLKEMVFYVSLSLFCVWFTAWMAGEAVPWWGYFIAFRIGTLDFDSSLKSRRIDFFGNRLRRSERSLEEASGAIAELSLTEEDRVLAEEDLRISEMFIN